MYPSKLFQVVKSHVPEVHAYADDTQIYLSFMPDSAAGKQGAIAALQNCITDMKSWMIADRLKLNDDKTEFMIIGTRVQLDTKNWIELALSALRLKWIDLDFQLAALSKVFLAKPSDGKSLKICWLCVV